MLFLVYSFLCGRDFLFFLEDLSASIEAFPFRLVEVAVETDFHSEAVVNELTEEDEWEEEEWEAPEQTSAEMKSDLTKELFFAAGLALIGTTISSDRVFVFSGGNELNQVLADFFLFLM